ncbi:MAG: efflux RND transporter periplasmic adaptor subunit [Enterobacterales bacterium]|nr:efflux RND transporter periplasmic adaptor subunit [Enterobacterales bacterium]
MTKNKAFPSKITNIAIAALVGGLVTYAVMGIFSTESEVSGNATSAKKQPIYWVAPMDANYRRDKPGKSPMGMDLVAVYADGGGGSDAGVGTIKISPEVVNNLGVRTAKAELKYLHTQIKTVGYVKYDEDQLVHIHPRVKGWIEKLYVKASGDPVTKGQPLYEIYSPELVNAQEEFLLALDRKNKGLIRAAKARLKALQIPTKEINRLLKTRQVTQRVTFFAPQSGVIDNLNIREGFYVNPSKTLMSIGQLQEVWVEAEVFERQNNLVKIGQPVTMTLDYLPGTEWTGKVDYIYPTLNKQTRTLKVRLRFKNPGEKLKPNMYAQVIIHPLLKEKSLVVPKEAVIRTGSMNRVVLAIGEGRYKSIEVKMGQVDDKTIQILAGLDEGEIVVTSAQFLLDSESSKSSDFKRMSHPLEESDTSSVSSISVKGVINSLMAKHRMLNISREAIPEWGRDAASVDFIATDAVDLTGLKQGMEVQFDFHLMDDNFMITDLVILGRGNDQSSSVIEETGSKE